MGVLLPPPPNQPVSDTHEWRDWFYTLYKNTTSGNGIKFTGLDFSGSNIDDIVTRDHNTLTNLQGGTSLQYFHLTSAEYAAVAGLGTMSTQNKTAVDITGGTIVGITNLNVAVVTVATLPVGAVGRRSFVTDALAPVFGAVVAGGGAVNVPVYYDGAAWRVG